MGELARVVRPLRCLAAEHVERLQDRNLGSYRVEFQFSAPLLGTAGLPYMGLARYI